MEEKGLGENKLVRDLSKGVILEEYVIKFLKEYNLDSYVTITEFSNTLVKELENILFLLDSNEIDLIGVLDNLQIILKEFEVISFRYDLDSKVFKKLKTEISS